MMAPVCLEQLVRNKQLLNSPRTTDNITSMISVILSRLDKMML